MVDAKHSILDRIYNWMVTCYVSIFFVQLMKDFQKIVLNWQLSKSCGRKRTPRDSWIARVSEAMLSGGFWENDAQNWERCVLSARNPDYGNTTTKNKDLSIYLFSTYRLQHNKILYYATIFSQHACKQTGNMNTILNKSETELKCINIYLDTM